MNIHDGYRRRNCGRSSNPLAREKRETPTPAENTLWKQIRNHQLGFRFRRQHPIGRFIVDFYCAEAGLIVEVDGGIHQYTVEEDAIRQDYLESLGFTVRRFDNKQVLQAIGLCLSSIVSVLPANP